ncbi:MAG: periplasmic binding protein [Myxococcales bacterium]|nr:periplasmic binding protein [Myxococcales bacterium]
MNPTRATVVVTLFLAALSGCHKPAPPAAHVRRVVSLAPSSTEILFALDAGPLVVGADQYSDYPPAARGVPRVGNDLAPSVERILGLKPDVVFIATTANSRDLAGELSRLGIRVVVSSAASLDDVFADIEKIGAAVERPAAATTLVATLRARIAAVTQGVAGKPRPRTAVVVWPDPLTVAGGKSFVDEAIRAAGGDNIAADSPQPYPQYSVERLLARAPEVVVVGTHATEPSLAAFEAYSSLPAVKAHRVHRVDGDLLFRPGPRLVDGIEALARLLHP